MPTRPRSTLLRLHLLGALALAGCSSDGAVAAVAPVVSIDLAAPATAWFVGDTVAPVALARDAHGTRIEGASLGWTSSNPAVLAPLEGGRFVAVGHGNATVHVTAGSASAELAVAVRLTTSDRRFAYALAHDPQAASYAPMRAFAFNATGGDIRIARQGTGRYVVTFGRMAKVDTTFKEVVLVTAFGSAGERCHIEGWADDANGRDLDAQVACYDAQSAPLDSRFTILAVGSTSLPGRHGFAAVDAQATAAAALGDKSFSSSGAPVGVDRSATGSYLVRLRAPRQAFPENYFVSTVGDAPDLCKVASWSFGDWASVVCYDQSGARADARFSLLMVEGGRPGKRFGFAWANDLSAPLGQSYSPAAAYQRSSSGQGVHVTHTALGEYEVEFPGLGSLGSGEIVQVSPFGSSLSSCQLAGWTLDALGALRSHVRCWNRASGAREDAQFTVLVVE